jgi:AraC-like DNA-binding protein
MRMKALFGPFCSPLYFRNGTASVFFSSCITPVHTHNTLQFVYDLTGSFLFRTKGEKWRKYQSLILRENVAHQLNTNGNAQLIIYIDALSDTASKIKQRYLVGVDCGEPEIEFSPLEHILFHENLVRSQKSLQLLVDLIINKLTISSTEGLVDGRIDDVVRSIKNQECVHLSIDQLADEACISPSRLRMQFKHETGVPLHHYLVRQRLLGAIKLIINGASIQNSAYAAGFNDTSHFHKLMLKMFGISPSAFIKERQNGFRSMGDGSLQLESVMIPT